MVQYVMGVPLRPAISAIRESRAALQIYGGSGWVGEREWGEIGCCVHGSAHTRAGVERGGGWGWPSMPTKAGPLAPHKRQVA